MAVLAVLLWLLRLLWLLLLVLLWRLWLLLRLLWLLSSFWLLLCNVTLQELGCPHCPRQFDSLRGLRVHMHRHRRQTAKDATAAGAAGAAGGASGAADAEAQVPAAGTDALKAKRGRPAATPRMVEVTTLVKQAASGAVVFV